MDSAIQGPQRKTAFPRPDANGFRFSESGNHPIIALIVRLLRWSRPSAIGRLIVAVSILAFNRVRLRRLESHVRQEIPKITPSFADSNSAPAIVWIKISTGIRAALKHICPSAVFRARFRRTAVMPMPQLVSVFETSARTDMAGLQVTRNHSGLLAAIASTTPSEFSAGRLTGQHFDHGKQIEPKARDIFEFPIVEHAHILAGGASVS
jgi:hypothetical protein